MSHLNVNHAKKTPNMDSSALSLTVQKFRAIDDATIDIDSITVLSGVNACGKSTIARLFHALVNFNANYARELLQYEKTKIHRVVDFFMVFLQNLDTPTFIPFFVDTSPSTTLDDTIEKATKWIQSTIQSWETIANGSSHSRNVRILLRNIGYPGPSATKKQLIEFIEKQFTEVSREYKLLSRKRTLFPFQKNPVFPAMFGRNKDSTVVLREYGEQVYRSVESSPRKLNVEQSMRELLGVKRAIYLTSPLVNTPEYKEGKLIIGDGFPIETGEPPLSDEDLFGALHGQISPSPTGVEFEYERDDGHLPFVWSELATGIKSLAILNILHNKGCLDDKTLLIIDEPEVHLHPQWVFEYARILSLVAKKLKVRLLIATHSPEMVGALKAVATAESIDGVRFYVADEAQSGKPYQYTFQKLGMNVEPIFKAFNVALDRIDIYEPDSK